MTINFPLLRSIEDERKDKSGWDKSAIFHKATIRPFREVNHADTAEDALQICLNRKLRVDLSLYASLDPESTGQNRTQRSWREELAAASISIRRNTMGTRMRAGNWRRNT